MKTPEEFLRPHTMGMELFPTASLEDAEMLKGMIVKAMEKYAEQKAKQNKELSIANEDIQMAFPIHKSGDLIGERKLIPENLYRRQGVQWAIDKLNEK